MNSHIWVYLMQLLQIVKPDIHRFLMRMIREILLDKVSDLLIKMAYDISMLALWLFRFSIQPRKFGGESVHRENF